MFGNPDIWMNSFAFLFYYSDYIKTHFHYIYLFSISAIREHIIVQYEILNVKVVYEPSTIWLLYNLKNKVKFTSFVYSAY